MENMNTETKKKGPIFCASDDKWKKELDRRLQTDERITLTALGEVKNELLRHLHQRKDIQILKIETRYIKKREKGTGLKVIVRAVSKPKPLKRKSLSKNSLCPTKSE
jgi:hypothetical protein